MKQVENKDTRKKEVKIGRRKKKHFVVKENALKYVEIIARKLKEEDEKISLQKFKLISELRRKKLIALVS